MVVASTQLAHIAERHCRTLWLPGFHSMTLELVFKPYLSNAPMHSAVNDFKVEKMIFKELMVHPAPLCCRASSACLMKLAFLGNAFRVVRWNA
jgi:hypothetical protein